MKTFTSKESPEPVTFMIDTDQFEAVPASQMPGGILKVYFDSVQGGEIFDANLEFFKYALTEESYKRFAEKFESKTDKPITITMMADVAAWLLGSVYMGEAGDTDQEQSSTSGPPKTKRGPGSTAGAAPKE